VVIAVFDPGLKFVLDHRDSLFPNVPVVFCSAHFYRVSGVQLPSDFTGVTYDLSYDETLDLAKRLRPGTRNVAVVSGSSDFGKAMLMEARSVLAEHSEFEFSFLTGVSVEETVDEVARLPEDSIVLFLVYVRDPQGRLHYANDVLSEVSAIAPVPTFCQTQSRPLAQYRNGTCIIRVARVWPLTKFASLLAAPECPMPGPSKQPLVSLLSLEMVTNSSLTLALDQRNGSRR
jgi:hypothetical protein